MRQGRRFKQVQSLEQRFAEAERLRRRISQLHSLEECLATAAKLLRDEDKLLPPGTVTRGAIAQSPSSRERIVYERILRARSTKVDDAKLSHLYNRRRRPRDEPH
jgi:hypothetical protein